MMRNEYDPEVDALSIRLRRGKVARTVRVTDEIRVDLDDKDRAVSLEILNASRHLTREALDQAQSAGRSLTLAEAGERSGRSPETLRGQIHKGRLKGSKRGRDWYVDATSLENYLEAVESGFEKPDRPAPARAKSRSRA